MLRMYQENCMFDFVADADLGSKFACQQWCSEICVCVPPLDNSGRTVR